MDQRQPDPIDSNPSSPAGPAPEERRFGDASATAAAWLANLQAMIDNLASQSAPVIREVGAKAAEVAAIAAERAGPLAQRAAEVTQDMGARIATRSRDLAAELRRPTAPEESDTGPAWTNEADPAASAPAREENATGGPSSSI